MRSSLGRRDSALAVLVAVIWGVNFLSIHIGLEVVPPFLFLVISQFLAHFNYSNLATIAAVNLSDLIERANMGALPLLVVFVFITALVNLIIPVLGVATFTHLYHRLKQDGFSET